jgi:hypothetical protein
LIEIIFLGPPIFKIQGTILYKVNLAAHPEDEENPKYGQLYFTDSSLTGEKAIDHRLSEPSNRKLDKDLLKELEKLFREKNPYAKAWMMMKEVEDEENLKAVRTKKNPPEIQLHFYLNKNLPNNQIQRYNPPAASNEV